MLRVIFERLYDATSLLHERLLLKGILRPQLRLLPFGIQICLLKFLSLLRNLAKFLQRILSLFRQYGAAARCGFRLLTVTFLNGSCKQCRRSQ